MDSITITMTAERMSQTPSYFGMSACGHVCVEGDMGLVPATATFLGTHAWSPPTS